MLGRGTKGGKEGAPDSLVHRALAGILRPT